MQGARVPSLVIAPDAPDSGFRSSGFSGFRSGLSARGGAALGSEFREIPACGGGRRRTKSRTENPQKAALGAAGRKSEIPAQCAARAAIFRACEILLRARGRVW
jgi:hypothetical protein